MKRALAVTGAVVASLALLAALPDLLPPDDIEFRGEKIRLAKFYFGYEHYKLDPQIAPFELPRVRQLLLTPWPQTFSSRKEFFAYGGNLWFPGYGIRGIGGPLNDGSRLEGVCGVIPPGEEWRCVLYRAREEHYELLDDFVAASHLDLGGVRLQGEELVYTAARYLEPGEGPEVLRRKVNLGGAPTTR